MVDLGWAIGIAATKWAIKLWSKDDPLVDLGAEIGDLLANTGRDASARRRTSAQLTMIAELVNERVQPLLAAEVPGIESNEHTAAVLAADRALTNALTIQVLFRSSLDSATLAQTIKNLDAEKHKQDALSEAAEGVYDLIISEASAYALQLSAKLPAFAVESTRAMFAQTNSIVNLVEIVLREMPPSRVPSAWGSGTDFQRFESRYMRAVYEQSNQLRLYGVTSPTARKTYPLSTAYIPLQSSATDGHEEMGSLAIEDALNLSQRLLISGDAGSGKTTLLQWITVTASKNQFTDDLSDLNGSIPFVLPLRRFSGAELPQPENWLKHITPALAGTMPVGWVHSVLDEGRALVLVDGFDEVPAHQRADSLDWLRSLETTFPDNYFVVTSRDVAVERSWQRGDDYRRIRLLPMEAEQITEFIEHWHAAAKDSEHDVSKLEEITTGRQTLLAAIRDRQALQSLADSPLLCALICAMNLEGGAQLPSSRMELYETALQMLVNKRDRDRRVGLPSLTEPNYAESSLVLESYALWLQDNRVADSSFEEFEARVGDVLPRLHRLRTDSDSLARFILERSGILREPIVGRVDFIHRTFLEFLAARAAVQGKYIQKLIHSADDDYWREVVVLAAGHASPDEREELIRGLVERGRLKPEHKHVLYLVAVGCMETSTELAPDLLRLLNECLAEVIPPRNMTDAHAIAMAGDMAVPLLATRRSRRALEAAASVRSLCLIGTDAAMNALRTYAADRRLTVARQIIRGWAYFDTEQYAQDIMSDSPLEQGELLISDPDLALHANHLKHATELSFVFHRATSVVTKLPPAAALKRLHADGATEIVDLSWSNRFPNLQVLRLMDSTLLNLEGAADLADLRSLDIDGTAVESLAPLSTLSRLSSVDVANTRINALTDLPASVTRLRIDNCAGLSDTADIPNVKSLQMSVGELVPLSFAISSSPALRELRLDMNFEDLQPISLSDSVESLRIFSADHVLQLPGGAGALQHLYVSASQIPNDWVAWLLSRQNLMTVRLDLPGSEVTQSDVEQILSIPSLVDFQLSMGLSRSMRDFADADGFQRIPRVNSIRYRRESNPAG